MGEELIERHFVAVHRHLTGGILQAGDNVVVLLGGQTEHLAHRGKTFYLLLSQLVGIGFVVTLRHADAAHHFGGHIHIDHQLAIHGFQHAIHGITQRLRFASHGSRIFEIHGKVKRAFAFAVFPAQRGDVDHRAAFQQQRQVIRQHLAYAQLITQRILRDARLVHQLFHLRVVAGLERLECVTIKL